MFCTVLVIPSSVTGFFVRQWHKIKQNEIKTVAPKTNAGRKLTIFSNQTESNRIWLPDLIVHWKSIANTKCV